MNGASGFREVLLLPPDHPQIGSYTSNSIIQIWFLAPLFCLYVFMPLSTPLPAAAEPGVTSTFPDLVIPPKCTEDSSKLLKIVKQAQETAFWCWAAATYNVTEYVYYRKQFFPWFNPTPRQCRMAEIMADVPNRTDTCCTPVFGWSDITCTTARWPEQIMDRLYFSYEPQLELQQDGTRHPETYGPLLWPQVAREICGDRPYISVIGPSKDQTHAVVVHGFSQHTVGYKGGLLFMRAVEVYDPLTDDSYLDFWRYSWRSPLNLVRRIPQFGLTHFGDTFNIKKLPSEFEPLPWRVVPPTH